LAGRRVAAASPPARAPLRQHCACRPRERGALVLMHFVLACMWRRLALACLARLPLHCTQSTPVTAVPAPSFVAADPPPRLLLGPGPSNAHPRVTRALVTPQLGHMDPYFMKIVRETSQLLKYVWQTSHEVCVRLCVSLATAVGRGLTLWRRSWRVGGDPGEWAAILASGRQRHCNRTMCRTSPATPVFPVDVSCVGHGDSRHGGCRRQRCGAWGCHAGSSHRLLRPASRGHGRTLRRDCTWASCSAVLFCFRWAAVEFCRRRCSPLGP
jgi:hypothetical protein